MRATVLAQSCWSIPIMLSAFFPWMSPPCALISLSAAVINIFAVAPAHVFSTCRLKFLPADCAHSIQVGSRAKTRLVMSVTIRPLLRAGGDAFLESTPPVLTYYQARSGQQFTLAIAVERLREYGQKQLSQLKLYLADAGIDAIGGDADHGAFLSVRHTNASDLAKKLAESNVITDARGEWLRLCPDCLTREEELRTAASALHRALEQMHS